MTKKIITTAIINSSKEEVWKELTHLENYKHWNPFIINASGKLQLNEVITIQMESMKFNPRIISYKPNSLFSWKGTLFLPKIFDGTHSFELIEISPTTTKLIHSEKFNGVLVPLLGKKFFKEIEVGFIKMNQALKARVEN